MLMSAPLVIEASAAHTASLIFLHGLGDTGYGWAPVMRQIARKFRFMKFILPHAPQRPVTLNYGMKMPAWYDIYTLSESDEREDEKGLHESTATLMDLVKKEESAGISPERIFIGGTLPWILFFDYFIRIFSRWSRVYFYCAHRT